MNPKNKNILVDVNDVLNTYKSKEHGVKALCKYEHWFPLKASAALAGIVADLMGDGHLQNQPKMRVDFTSKSVKELMRFNNEVFKIFGIKGKIRNCTTNKYNTKNLGINNKPLGRVLKIIGVPTGAKVFSKFPIPQWILENRLLFSRFVNRLFSCEGCVDMQSRYIELKMFKSVKIINSGLSFFNDIKLYLNKYFAIKTTNPFMEGKANLRKDGEETRAIKIKIKNKESLLRFRRYVGIDDENKKRKLDLILQ